MPPRVLPVLTAAFTPNLRAVHLAVSRPESVHQAAVIAHPRRRRRERRRWRGVADRARDGPPPAAASPRRPSASIGAPAAPEGVHPPRRSCPWTSAPRPGPAPPRSEARPASFVSNGDVAVGRSRAAFGSPHRTPGSRRPPVPSTAASCVRTFAISGARGSAVQIDDLPHRRAHSTARAALAGGRAAVRSVSAGRSHPDQAPPQAGGISPAHWAGCEPGLLERRPPHGQRRAFTALPP